MQIGNINAISNLPPDSQECDHNEKILNIGISILVEKINEGIINDLENDPVP